MASEAKKAAAQTAARQPDASAARPRTWPISVHLTPFAAGCGHLPINDKRRWRTFYGRTPTQVVKATLARLHLKPADVSTSCEVNGDVNILAPVAPEVLKLISGAPSEPVPFATFWDGLPEAELQAALAALKAAGWVPDQMGDHPYAA